MAKRKIYVLIACEESQAECSEFRKAGFVAFSCDLQKCGRNANPSWHIRGDVVPFLYGRYEFKTMDGKRHKVPRWDLIVAHPPCTYLCKLSSVQLTKAGVLDRDRYMKLIEAREFFLVCLHAVAPFVAVILLGSDIDTTRKPSIGRKTYLPFLLRWLIQMPLG